MKDKIHVKGLKCITIWEMDMFGSYAWYPILVTTIKINIRLPIQMQYLPNGNATQARLRCSSLQKIYGRRHHELVDSY
jgi:hypothetical protein